MTRIIVTDTRVLPGESVVLHPGQIDPLGFVYGYIAGAMGNAGLMAFTRALGGASHADSIRVLGINPGPTATDRLITLYRQRAETLLGDAKRYEELFQKGTDSSLDAVLSDQTKRDRDDSARAIAPLKAAEDAIRVDSSQLPLSEVVQSMERAIRERMASPAR